MKKILGFLIVLVGLLGGADYAHATACTTTTVSSTGLVDSDSLTWANGTWSADIVLPPGVFYSSAMTCTTAGNTFLLHYSGTLASDGSFSQAIPSNTTLAPAGSQWAFTFCPNAVRGCYVYTATVFGTSLNITTPLNAVLPGPRFNYVNSAYGYDPVELTTSILTGQTFYNTTTSTQVLYNGTSWVTPIVAVANLTGGAAGKIPYQSAANTTAFSAVITTNTLIKGGGTGAPAASGIVDNGVFANTSEFIKSTGNTQILLTDFSSAAVSPGSGAAFTWGGFPASSNFAVHCAGTYSQTTANAGVGFSIQSSAAAPTRIDAVGTFYITNPASTTITGSTASVANVTTNTTSVVVSATPNAAATAYKWEFDALVQTNTTGLVLALLPFTANAGDVVVLRAGSYCTLF